MFKAHFNNIKTCRYYVKNYLCVSGADEKKEVYGVYTLILYKRKYTQQQKIILFFLKEK